MPPPQITALNSIPTALWTHLETKYLSKISLWSNTLSYGSIVNQGDVDDMVNAKFGGYNQSIKFTIGTTHYKLKALPIQNKVASHGGAASAGNTDTMVNIICGPEVGPFGTPPLFNFHIDTRTAARAAALAARQALRDANALAAANNDFQVQIRRGRKR
jgi:hypothetical protein